jgi:hypothetical protein
MSSSDPVTINPQRCLKAGVGNLYLHPLVAGWLLVRLKQRDISVLLWLQAGDRQLCEHGPHTQVTKGNTTSSEFSVEIHTADRMCVSVLPSATATINELLGVPHGEIHLPRRNSPPRDEELRPLHLTPGRLHPLPHTLAGPQHGSSGLVISLEQSQFDFINAFHMRPSPRTEKYHIDGTHYAIRGRMSLHDLGIAMPVPKLPCFQLRIEWNSRLLDLRSSEEEWILGTGLESVTKSEEDDMIWLERK